MLEGLLPGFGEADVWEGAQADVTANVPLTVPRQIQCLEIDFRLRDS